MSRQPNILMIVCDSARADAYNGVGGEMSWIETPTADRLAREGVTFTNAFTPIGICHPARACMETGRHAHANGQLVNTVWDKPGSVVMRDDAPSFMRVLQSVGYRVAYTGQRHLHESFFDDVIPGAITAFKAAGLQMVNNPDRPQNRFFGELELPVDQHRDAFTKRGAIALLERYAAQEKPWMIQCDFDGPHPPFQLPVEYARMYDPDKIQKPCSFDDDPTGKAPAHARARRDQLPLPWGDEWRQLIAHYGGYVTMLDAFTGEILETLERLGMADNTVVIFTSDHGELVGAHGAVTKYSQMYDEVLHIPMIARWPGRTTPGSIETSFTSHVDLLPTFADLSGAPLPEGIHGRSWAPVLRGEPLPEPRTVLYGELHGWGTNSWYSLRMARTHEWKYVWSPFVDEELYDLVHDPCEIVNIAAQRPDQVAAMRKLLGAEMRAVNDPLAGHQDFRG